MRTKIKKNMVARSMYMIREFLLQPTRFVFLLAGIVGLTMVFSLMASEDATANDKFLSFEVDIDGYFLTGPGPPMPPGTDRPDAPDSSVLFTVTETGWYPDEGEPEIIYSSTLRHNTALVPKRCTTGSGNTGVDGKAVMVIDGDEMRLRREKCTVCVDYTEFPYTLDIQEEWRIIAGGTGRFEKATGKLTRVLNGLLDKPQPGPFPFTSTFSGSIRLD